MKLCPSCEAGYHDSHTTCPTHGVMLHEIRELKPGMVIRQTYRIVRKLGEGGMGTVYLADHLHMEEQRALKFLSAAYSEDEDFKGRFRREVRTLRRVRHKNVIDCGDLEPAEDGSLFFSMEFVDGPPDLWRFMRTAPKPFDVGLALQIARGIAEGLGSAHAIGVVHRDIKPENILMARVEGVWVPKIADFGIVATKESSNAYTRAKTSATMLSMAYAAPEQWQGRRGAELDGRTDLYALGGILFEILTGRTALEADSYEGWAEQHKSVAPRRPSEVRPDLAEWQGLDELVLRLLAKDREQRPANVAEVLRELDAIRWVGSAGRRRTEVIGQGGRVATVVESTGSRGAADTGSGEKKAVKNRVLRWAMVAGVVLIAGGLAVAGVRMYEATKTGQAGADSGVAAGTVRGNLRDGLKYVWIPAGSFAMGCDAGDSQCQAQEKPAHQVTISKGFWMGQTPVTVAAWKRYRAGTNAPALPTTDGLGRTNLNEAGPEEMPVVSESWEQAAAFCQWAGMRLPTEAEWEYAARAGSEGQRYGSLEAIAWYADNSGIRPIGSSALFNSLGKDVQAYEQRLKENGNSVHPVGLKQPNAWQLYDTLGDVLEWTADWYDAGYYSSSADRDPAGPAGGQDKVVRGAAWSNIPEYARVSARTAASPGRQATGIGFRCIGQISGN